jgi:hypothetical protein
MASAVFRAAVRILAPGMICAGSLAGYTSAAGAQGIGNMGAMTNTPGAAPSFANEQLDRSLQGRQKPPAALPGAQSKEDMVAPPSQIPSLMSPTGALFDAISRGDIAAARDAISRGADLGGKDELGMTPLDLSIDLGRNDISFLLLSMRAADSQAGPPPTATATADKATGALVAGAARRHPGAVRQASARAPAAQGQIQTLPKLFAGNGGVANPEAGFLGFGGR